MGGKLLKKWDLPEKRLSTSEYEVLKDDLLDILAENSRNMRFEVSPYVRDKESHGDIDIICSTPNTKDDSTFLINGESVEFVDFCHFWFNYKPHKNGNVYSFPYKGFQVDLCFHHKDEIDTAVAYTSWGDLGNLMGRVYHKMGYHYGHDGLTFWIREGLFRENNSWSDSDHIYEKYIFDKDIERIFKIGGFDYQRWLEGFNDMQEVFAFVCSSDYFDPESYKLENLNHANRTRNKKRPMFMKFVEYVEEHNPPKGKKTLLSKENYSLLTQWRYPELKKRIDNHRFNYYVEKSKNEKINGKLVIEWLDLDVTIDGKLVGQIMSDIRTKYSSLDMLSMSQEELKYEVFKIRKNYEQE